MTYWPKDCPNCKKQPTRRTEDGKTWLVCETCEVQSSLYDLRSDDYAYTNSGRSWNHAVRRAERIREEAA